MLERSSITTLLHDDEVESILGVHSGWCAKDRISQGRIPHLKIGRSVRYRESDVMAYLDRCVRQSTSDSGKAAA